MKQLGNLALVCARRKNTLLQVLNGEVSVHIGRGPSEAALVADWNNDEQISKIIRKLNFGKYKEN